MSRDRIREALMRASSPALVSFLTAGFPTRDRFEDDLRAIASTSDVVEIGVPFSDPMADGLTIQRASHAALRGGFTLSWLLSALSEMKRPEAPLVLMSYLNPLLAFGLPRLAEAATRAGVSGFIVPDLPYEESEPLRAALDEHALLLVQMVTPVTPDERLATLCRASQGFVYAVTQTGTTGKGVADLAPALAYLDRVRRVAPLPVCAGFGIRSAAQVAQLRPHVDGVVVGSALVEVLERGEDPAAFLRSLR